MVMLEKRKIEDNISAPIFNIQKFSVHDGPGIRTIVFLKGCPLNCIWCANPESKNRHKEVIFHRKKCIGCKKCYGECGQKAITIEETVERDVSKCINCGACVNLCYAGALEIAGEEMSLEEVKREVDKDIPFYKRSGGGITFSGGEPLLHADFIENLANYYKEKQITTAMETCGYGDWDKIERLVPYIDYFLFDLKLINNEKHKQFTGVSNKTILENLNKLIKLTNVTVRIPIIPTINDEDSDIRDFLMFLTDVKESIKEVNILPYHNFGLSKYDGLGEEYKLKELETPSKEKMQEIKEILEKGGFKVKIGG